MGLNHPDWQAVRREQPFPWLNRRAPRSFLTIVGLTVVGATVMMFDHSAHPGHVHVFVTIGALVGSWGFLTGIWPRRGLPHRFPTVAAAGGWIGYLFARHYISRHLHGGKNKSGVPR